MSVHRLARTRFAAGVMALTAITAVVWLVLWAAIVPLVRGWSPVAVVSGSMAPLIDSGDIVVAAPYGGQRLDAGAVIVFDNPAGTGSMTHRVVDVTPGGDYVTRGDANGHIDSTAVPPETIQGVGRILVPAIATPFVWANNSQWTHLSIAAAAILAALWASRWALLARHNPWTHRPPPPVDNSITTIGAVLGIWPTPQPAAVAHTDSPAPPPPTKTRTRRGPQRLALATVSFAAIASAVLVAPNLIQSQAAFTNTPDNAGNSFSAAASWTTVQSGTASISSNGGTNTLTVPITSLDPSKAFLIFESRHDGDRPATSMVRGRIASATSLEFVRVSDDVPPGIPIDIEWYVVEFPNGVNVQRGVTSQSATTVDVSITPVAAMNQAFVTWSKTAAATDVTWGDNDPLVGELTSLSNLQFRVNAANASHVIWWQVVEFANAADINVQKGTTSMLGTATSTNVTLGTPVDVNATFVLVGFRTSGTDSDVGSRMLRARLIDSDTITIDRSISGSPDDITEISWQAVELKNGSSVQRGSETFSTTVAQMTVPISSVSSRAVAFASVQPAGGQNMGRSPYAGDDVIGVCSVTMSLSAALITMDRNNTAAACDIGWFVVDFAP